MAKIRDDRCPGGDVGVTSDSTATFGAAVRRVGFEPLLGLPTELHEAMATESRQEILAYLHGEDRVIGTDELATYLAAIGVEADERRAKTALHHAHLPTLDELGVIRWNAENGTVRLSVVERG